MTRHVVRFAREGRRARCCCGWGSDGSVRQAVIDAAERHAHDNAGQLEYAGSA
jgi:hypothetical protein